MTIIGFALGLAFGVLGPCAATYLWGYYAGAASQRPNCHGEWREVCWRDWERREQTRAWFGKQER